MKLSYVEDAAGIVGFFGTLWLGFTYLHGPTPIPGLFAILGAFAVAVIIRWFFKVVIRQNYL